MAPLPDGRNWPGRAVAEPDDVRDGGATGMEDGGVRPAVVALAVDARWLVHRADAVPLPPQQLDGWASPAARAYAADVRALQRAVAELRGALGDLAALLARAAP